MPRLPRRLGWIALAAILVLAGYLRRHTFDMIHYRGDQHTYVVLAFKLATGGIDAYNLGGVDLRMLPERPGMVSFVRSGGRGYVLDMLAQHGFHNAEAPLFQTSYGFPLAVWLSHEIFSRGEPYQVLAIQEPASRGFGGSSRHQFYAVIVPFAFSLLLVGLAYALGVALYDSWVTGAVAAFLIAISPVDLLTSQRIWADDMTAALVVAAVLLLWWAREKQRWVLALLAGACCGLATIAKPSGAFVIPAILLADLWARRRALPRRLAEVLLDRDLLLFALGALLAAGHWFWAVWAEYGTPVHLPPPEETEWLRVLRARPAYLYVLGAPYLNPMFALAYLAPLWTWWDGKRARSTAFLLVWIAAYLVIFTFVLRDAREERYLLPAYAAYAVLAGHVADRARAVLDGWLRGAGSILLAAALAASAWWSVPIGTWAAKEGLDLILKPW